MKPLLAHFLSPGERALHAGTSTKCEQNVKCCISGFPVNMPKRKMLDCVHLFFSPYEKGVEANDDLEIYEGTFRNFAYGNITVTMNSTLNLLQMRMSTLGLWNLYAWPPGEGHRFWADGIDDIWPIDVNLWFSSRDPDTCPDCIDLLTVEFESAMPPVFERNLKMADAPPPPSTECSEINSDPDSDSAVQNAMSYFSIVLSSLIVYTFHSVLFVK